MFLSPESIHCLFIHLIFVVLYMNDCFHIDWLLLNSDLEVNLLRI